MTLPEVRRLVEGRRVYNEIQNRRKEAENRGTSAAGTTMPRKSDRKQLKEFDKRLKRN